MFTVWFNDLIVASGGIDAVLQSSDYMINYANEVYARVWDGRTKDYRKAYGTLD